MKTNHRRGFRAKPHRDKAMFGTGRRSEYSDVSVGAGIGNDFSKGNRGMAKAVRGAKKFVRSRIRFHDRQKTRALKKDPS